MTIYYMYQTNKRFTINSTSVYHDVARPLMANSESFTIGRIHGYIDETGSGMAQPTTSAHR